MAMTASELRALGLAMFGPEWQSPLARAIGVGARHIRRLAAGGTPISPAIEADIRRALGADDGASPLWPLDEWIIGDGRAVAGARREYIVHTRAPRFIARVYDEEGGEALPADTLTGVTYSAGGAVLCEIAWLDAPPGPVALHKLLEAAADALDASADGD